MGSQPQQDILLPFVYLLSLVREDVNGDDRTALAALRKFR